MIIIKPEVKGTRRVEYTNKEGKQVSGCEYHFSWEADNVIGLACASAFFSDREMGGARFEIGDIFTLAYDPYAKRKFNFLPL